MLGPELMSQLNANMQILRTFRDTFQEDLIEELRRDFRDYRHHDVGFGALLKSLTYGVGEDRLRDPEFRRELKYELKLIMNYMHMVRDRNTLREIKTSTFPMLLLGVAGDRTSVKLVMIATYLSAKAMPFVADTFSMIVKRPQNRSQEFVNAVYAQMLSDLRLLATREGYHQARPECAQRTRKLAAFLRLRLRKKNELRNMLGLQHLNAHPDDPYRALPVVRAAGEEDE